MKRIVMDAAAKLNPFLEIIKKRKDGYHDIDSLMMSVSIYDRVTVTEKERGIAIKTNTPVVPGDCENTAYIAAEKFFSYCRANGKSVCGGVEIDIEKHIPTRAGMGGGSTDAAAVIVALDRICETGFSREELWKIGALVGADVPFCITGGCIRVGNIGDRFISAHTFPDYWITVVKPFIGISTPAAYSTLDRIFSNFTGYCPRTPELLIAQFDQTDPFSMYRRPEFYNVFQRIAPLLAPSVPSIIEFLEEHSFGALLSGSGDAIFAVSGSREYAQKLADEAAKHFNLSFTGVCKPVDRGITVIEG